MARFGEAVRSVSVKDEVLQFRFDFQYERAFGLGASATVELKDTAETRSVKRLSCLTPK